MKCFKRVHLSAFWVIIGAALLGLSIAGVLDEFWGGAGGGFMAVGILQLIRFTRYNRNEQYREKTDIESKDERNQYIAGKAWEYTGKLYVVIAALTVIALHLAGKAELSQVVSFSICGMIALYWVFYFTLRSKY